MKLLIDMNLSPRWVATMTAAGFEGAHWSMLGAHDASDATIVEHARNHDYIVLTHDLDFSAILAATHGEKPSVVQLRADDVRPEAIGPQVIRALHQMERELREGALLTIDPIRTRLRVLPLRLRVGSAP